MNYSQLKKALGLILVAMSLAACQPKESSSPISVGGRSARTAVGTVQQVSHSGLKLNGIVTGDNQQRFQEAVTGFMSATVAPEYVGAVGANGEQGTGVFIGGYVPLASGSLRNMNGQVMRISSNAKLVVAVYDYFPDQSGLGPLPPVVFTNAEGEIAGNQAVLEFWDEYGTVRMEGQFDQNTFYGLFSYDNRVYHDGSRVGHAGRIGTFEVPTCQFFVCN